MRVGHGYDLHRLEPRPPAGKGKQFVLGGIQIEHSTGLVAHSDGDVLLHAVTDAILGALGLPDIGQLFPDNDPKNESADSAIFLCEAVDRMRKGDGRLATSIAQSSANNPRSDRAEAKLSPISRG